MTHFHVEEIFGYFSYQLIIYIYPPAPQVGPGPGPGGMPPLPQGFVPPNLPPLGVPPPMGLPPLGVHPPVSSILGQPLIGAIPPPVSMAPNMPNRGLSEFQFLQLNISLNMILL